MNLRLAKSLCGHDKNEIYVVYREENDFVYLINGKTKTIEKPKRKKQRHIQIIKNLPEEIIEMVSQELTNETAKKIIKHYVRSIQCQKQM
ncbi:MAG: KOW domain-containing RNA-binding protein [Lachnospiraceae bacterium]|jgi:DNA-binding transcriptional regulator YhcF (GntR family)|nr:KOW domain-containing RNA-binding protein [Lachnospiraceae bacterium]